MFFSPFQMLTVRNYSIFFFSSRLDSLSAWEVATSSAYFPRMIFCPFRSSNILARDRSRGYLSTLPPTPTPHPKLLSRIFDPCTMSDPFPLFCLAFVIGNFSALARPSLFFLFSRYRPPVDIPPFRFPPQPLYPIWPKESPATQAL